MDQKLTKEEMIEQIRIKAESYVPEWRFSREQMDIGSALALVFAEMLFGTARKYQEIPYKNQIAFLNSTGADLLPAVPANGYVTFDVVNEEMEGEELLAGTEVICPAAKGGQEAISYETKEDVFVTPAKVDCMLQVCGESDYIGESGISDLASDNVFLFSESDRNLQSHRMFFCQDDALGIWESGMIKLKLFLRGQPIHEQLLAVLADSEQVMFSYSTADGYVPFRSIKQLGDELVILLGKNDPPFESVEEMGKESFWICCEAKRLDTTEKLLFDQISIVSSCNHIGPQSIYANGKEERTERFFPFGERFTDYNEVYFQSDEVLTKKGAEITVSFQLEFARVPLDLLEEESTQWEWIMKRSDFKFDLEYDITVEEVVWEYFNGAGWTALFPHNEYADIFSVEEGKYGQYLKMTFRCPRDLEPILVNAKEGYYIRARVVKVNNLYKMRGSYLSPFMDHVHFQYSFQEHPVHASALWIENNCARRQIRQKLSMYEQEVRPFYGLTQKERMIYLGFDIQPKDGPLKLFLDFAGRTDGKDHTLLWEYSTGESSWKELNYVDETENLSRSGIVTIMGNKEISRRKLYGFEKYWIRITDAAESYRREGNTVVRQPCLCGMYMNTVRIRQFDQIVAEYFHMETYQENMQFRLLQGQIIESRVWIDEKTSLSRDERDTLRRRGLLEEEYGEDGMLLHIWVEWQRVEDFLDSLGSDRHYLLEPNEGTIRFGNGRYGRMPMVAREDNIRIIYKTGGGGHTNIESEEVSQLGSYVGFINRVYNPKRLTGGNDRERMDEALRRNAARLRHQNRAISERDFEEIVMEASRSIQRVRCFSGYNAKEERQPGAVTLVILQKDLKNGQNRFYDIQAEVESYLKNRIYTGLWDKKCFYVIQPEFVELCVRAEAVVEHFEDVFRVKKKIQSRLEEFLNPLTGNLDGNGWEIGVLPNRLQLQNAISDIPGLSYLRNIYLHAFQGAYMDRKELNIEKVRKKKFVLPINGEHDIIVRVLSADR